MSNGETVADNPLKAGDLKLLNQVLWKVEQALHIIDQAERAGVDVSNIRMVRDDIYDQASRIKSVFFPGAQ